MDDAGLVDKEEFGSTHTRARKVHGEVLRGPERRRRWSLEEKLRILAQSVAPGSSATSGLPAARDQQRPALHLAASVSHGRADRICASEIGAAG